MFGSGDTAAHRDPAYVDIEDAQALEYWTGTLKVDEPTLRGAIQAVGFTARDVRDYLKMRQAAPHAP